VQQPSCKFQVLKYINAFDGRFLCFSSARALCDLVFPACSRLCNGTSARSRGTQDSAQLVMSLCKERDRLGGTDLMQDLIEM